MRATGQKPHVTERPELEARPDPDVFTRFYYLEEELLAFCRQNGLSTTGSKADLSVRIEHFLRTGGPPDGPEARRAANTSPRRPARGTPAAPSMDAEIGSSFKCTEANRAFFESVVGPRFHFSVKLQRYLRSNPTATYADAIAEWRRLDGAAASPAATAGSDAGVAAESNSIDPQFEYNRYIRAFFADNPGRSLAEAIACWRLRRSLPGPRAYDRTDLSALSERET
jgi:hypothetical protein